MAILAIPQHPRNAVFTTEHTASIGGIVAAAVAKLAGSSNFDRDQFKVRLDAQRLLRDLTPELSLTDYLEAYCRVYRATAFPRTVQVAATLRAMASPAPRLFVPEAWEYERFALDLEREEATAMHADHLASLAEEHDRELLPNDPDDLSDFEVDDQADDDDRIDWSDMIPDDGRDDGPADLFAPTACHSS